MDKLFEDQSQEVVKDNLEAMASATEDQVYEKPLNKEEVSFAKDELAQKALQLQNKKDVYDVVKEKYNAEKKELEVEYFRQLDMIRHKSVKVEGVLYLVDDQEEKLMSYYDVEGTLVHTRGLLLEERQTTIMSKIAAEEAG